LERSSAKPHRTRWIPGGTRRARSEGQGDIDMATICPIDGCKKKTSLCIHDKLMIVMIAMMAVGAVSHWGLHLF